MAWTVANPVSIGAPTKKSDYDKLWDNCDFFKIDHNTDGTHKKLTVGSDADGDIYYRNGGVLVRLPKGAALKYCRMNGAGTLPEWADGYTHPNHTGDVTSAGDGATTIAALAVNEGKVAASAISQAKLKTSTGEVSQAFGGAGSVNKTLPGGEYGFYPQIKTSDASCACLDFWIGDNYTGTSYTTNIAFVAGDAVTAYARQRYVTSSGEVFWVFLLRNRKTGLIQSAYSAPDHPCFGHGGKPLAKPHPFSPYREGLRIIKAAEDMARSCSGVDLIRPTPSTHDFIVINPDDSGLAELESNVIVDDESKPDLSLLQVIMEQYEVDEKGGTPDWPSKAVTVGLPRGTDWRRMPEGTLVTPIKKVIPRPEYVLTRTLRRKGLKEI